MKHQHSAKKNVQKKVSIREKSNKQKESHLMNEMQGVLENFSHQLPMLNNFSEKDITGMMAMISNQLNHIDYKSAFKGVFKNAKEDAAFTEEFTCLLDHLNNISKMMTKDLH